MFVCDCMNMSTRLWWREKKATRKSKAFLMSVGTSIITKHIHTKMTMTPNGPTEWHPDRIAAKITQAMEHTVFLLHILICEPLRQSTTHALKHTLCIQSVSSQLLGNSTKKRQNNPRGKMQRMTHSFCRLDRALKKI